ncbi:MAG: PAS domain S-box protein [Bacteroidota bacterium]
MRNKKIILNLNHQSITKGGIYNTSNPLHTLPGTCTISDTQQQDMGKENKNPSPTSSSGDQQYYALFSENTAVMLLIDPSTGHIVDANKAACKFYGYALKGLTSMKIQDINTLSEEQVEAETGRAKKQKKNHFLFEHRKANGTVTPVEVFSGKITVKDKPFLFSIVHDISEHKRSSEELKKSEERLRMMLDASPFPVALVDTQDDIIQYWSRSASALFGHTAPTADEWYQMAYPDKTYRQEVIDRWKSHLEKARISAQPVNTGEYNITCRDGSVLICELYATFLEDYLLVTFNDITKRKQDETALLEAKEKAEESDRLKSAFLANMSHEIRTPMNSILGFTELLKEPTISIEQQQDFIQTIEISGARMLNTINNIVDVSKIESGLTIVDIKETNLNEKIEFIYKLFKPEAENKGLHFLYTKSLPAGDAIINTDDEKVHGIITNLIKNALKFTYDGSIEFGYEKKGGTLEFYVKDTGTGINQKQKEFIFERFRQGSDKPARNYEGSGLGLSIAKSYVEMLGGKIWVESQEGRGSTFYFTIPYDPVAAEKTESTEVTAAESENAELSMLNILVVEDDELSYSLLSITLRKISKKILLAVTGVEAIQVCRNNPDLDLILMDIRMPVMDGLEATRQIRRFNKEIIIIAQTAYGFESDYKKAMDAGCNDYVSKPLNINLLQELIKKHCTKH